MYLPFFFVKRSKKVFPFTITIRKCSRRGAFNFFNHKSFFRPIWNIAFCKYVFIFWYSNSITNFKFRIFIANVFIRVLYVLEFISTDITLIVLWCELLYVLAILSNLLKSYTYKVFSQDSDKYIGNNRFSFIMYWMDYYILFF